MRLAKLYLWLSCALVLSCHGVAWSAPADNLVVPGRSVGRVFLGMDRADVWKILGKPGHTATVPHGMSLYGDDTREGRSGDLTILSTQDKVIQFEFDSMKFITPDGLSTASTLTQIHRRYPALTASVYRQVFRKPNGVGVWDRSATCYLDDVDEGVAFTVGVADQDGDYPNEQPFTLIIHRLGYSAVPLSHGKWLKRKGTDRNLIGLSRIRSLFTQGKGN